MYTYRKPFYRPATTKESIEYRAKRELFHATRMNTAVGFIGSGVTAGYGRLSYNELVRLLLERTFSLLRDWRDQKEDSDRTHAPHDRDVERLSNSLARQLGQFTGPDSVETVDPKNLRADFIQNVETSTALLEVLNELTEALGKPDALAKEVARLFRSRPLDQFDARLRLMGGVTATGGASLHDQWIRAILGRTVKDDENNDPLNSKNFSKVRGIIADIQSNIPLEPKKTAKETIPAALEAALWNYKLNWDTDTCKQHYDALREDFESINKTYPGFLYVPKTEDDDTDPGATPTMQQVVIGTWTLLTMETRTPQTAAQLKRKFRAIFFSLVHLHDLDDIALGEWPDPIDGAVRGLGLQRLLTVNYDLELERYFRRRFGVFFGPRQRDDGAESVDGDIDAGRGLPQHDEEDREVHFSGMGVRLVRAEMQKTSTSELLDFAIPHDEDMHLYYLHGRAEHPSEMSRERLIVSESDYQRHYLANNQVRRGFDESLRAMFAANTVVFLGLGMQEPDLLRPLRQFVSDDQKWRRSSGGPIVIMNGESEVNDEKRAVKLNVEFGAKALFYKTEIDVKYESGASKKLGVKPLFDLCHEITALISALDEKLEPVGSDGVDAQIDKRKGAVEKFRSAAKQHKEAIDSARQFARTFPELTSLPKLDLLALCPAADKILDATRCSQLLLCYAYLDRVANYIISASLTRFLNSIKPEREVWLKEWRRLPDQRISRFIDWRENKDKGRVKSDGIERCLWIRQRIKHSDGEDETSAWDCRHFRELTLRMQHELHLNTWRNKDNIRYLEFGTAEQEDLGRRILRVSGRRGAGKGALVHALQQGYHYLLDERDGTKPRERYAGAFFADARYSTEFNSVLTSLVRFVAGRTVQARRPLKRATDADVLAEASKAEVEVFGDGTRSRFDKLGFCFDELREKLIEFKEVSDRRRSAENLKHADRLFICLTGIERLFAAAGQAYQAVHGQFFRHLCGPEFRDFPIDLVFVVGGDRPQEISDLKSWVRSTTLAHDGQAAEDAVQLIGFGEAPQPLFPQDDGGAPNNGADAGGTFKQAPATWWHMRSHLPIHRKWIFKNLDHTSRDRTKRTFLELIHLPRKRDDIQLPRKQDDNNYTEVHTLYALLKGNTVIHMWLMHLFQELWTAEVGGARELLAQPQIAPERLVFSLETAATEGEAEVIEQIMNAYREIDEPRRLGKPKSVQPSVLEVHDEIMRHLAFFSVPVERNVLASCPRIIELARRVPAVKKEPWCEKTQGDTERSTSEWLQSFLDTLYRRRMIIRLYPSRPRDEKVSADKMSDTATEPHIRYYLHSRMREHISRQMKFDLFEFGEHSYFNLSLFAAQPKDLPSPRSYDYKFVGDILHRLIRTSREDVKPFFNSKLEQDEPNEAKRKSSWDRRLNKRHQRLMQMDTPFSPGRRIRAAQSLLAGSFSIGVITRFDNPRGLVENIWESDKPFDNYDGWLRSLTNEANAIDETEEAFCEAVQNGMAKARKIKNNGKTEKLRYNCDLIDWHQVPKTTRPFYPNEIAWLYNEQGLCKLVQGRVNEALKLFSQCEDLLRTLRWQFNDPQGVSYSSLRILRLNNALALIENGRSVDAVRTLENMANRTPPTDREDVTLTPAIARGYLGLVYHLQGRLDSADRCYRKAIQTAIKKDVPRATAIFLRHRSDLYRGVGELEKAEELVNRAIYEANSTRQMDIFHLGRISLARIRYSKDRSDVGSALVLLDAAATYAERLGIPKIQVEVDSFRSQILLEKGDLDAAGDCLVKAIATASRFGMNLRKIGAVNNYIRLAAERDDTKLVRRLRRKLTDLTEKFNHQLHSNQVRRLTRIDP